MSALTKPSRVPIHSRYSGTSFCTTSASSTVGAGGAFAAEVSREQPTPMSSVVTITPMISGGALRSAADIFPLSCGDFGVPTESIPQATDERAGGSPEMCDPAIYLKFQPSPAGQPML